MAEDNSEEERKFCAEDFDEIIRNRATTIDTEGEDLLLLMGRLRSRCSAVVSVEWCIEGNVWYVGGSGNAQYGRPGVLD